MTLALADRQEGYYRHTQPLGTRGDFTTAPEISQIFGELIGAALAQSWLSLGRPVPFNLVELGPGRGTLMADALRATRAVPGWLDGMELHLVESNIALRQQQDLKLATHRPHFYDTIEALPTNRPQLIVANEFFDCLPIHQFVRTERGWQERLIDIDQQGQFMFRLDHRSLTLKGIEAMAIGQVIETSPTREALTAQLAERIAATNGLLLIIDYGSLMDEHGDTFQAVRNHQPSNPLVDVGLSDLTSHVQFNPLKSAAIKAGCGVFGPISQHEFLNRLGAAQRYEGLSETASASQREILASGLARVIDPAGMGTLFKVMALTNLPEVPGFLPQEGTQPNIGALSA